MEMDELASNVMTSTKTKFVCIYENNEKHLLEIVNLGRYISKSSQNVQVVQDTEKRFVPMPDRKIQLFSVQNVIAHT